LIYRDAALEKQFAGIAAPLFLGEPDEHAALAFNIMRVPMIRTDSGKSSQ
jgi:hypothetical protein